MSLVASLFTLSFVSLGLIFFVAGLLGLMRFPDPLSRLHALSKADNLGLGLIVLGLLPQAAWPFGALKLVALWVLVLISGSIAGQLLAATLSAADDRLEGQPTLDGDRSPGRAPSGSSDAVAGCAADAGAGAGDREGLATGAEPEPRAVLPT